MKVEDFIKILGVEFFTGVPDSQLKALCNYLMEEYGICDKHIIAANEGNCTALAAGYYLATGKIPLVYMQNSGEGNIINPVASLLNDNVYGIPCVFVIGWRGEPGIHDEPQHIYQGKVTLRLLKDMDIEYFIVTKETAVEDVKKVMSLFDKLLQRGKQVAFVVSKDALEHVGKIKYSNGNTMFREDIIKHIVAVSGTDPIISTTGKTSRELFEIREGVRQSHSYDFLTVGSMGHSSSIALAVALNKPDRKIWIIDGDGAALMHLGAMAVIGSMKPKNVVHVVINNCSHETVGGMPTVAERIDLSMIAKACGYDEVVCADNFIALDNALKYAKDNDELIFMEVKSAIGSRDNLGRPTTSPADNILAFMKELGK